MPDQPRPPAQPDAKAAEYPGPERRSGKDRRRHPDPKPPPGQRERRRWVRRKADRLALERAARVGSTGPGGRLYRRVHLELPVIYRPAQEAVTPTGASRRGRTFTLAPGGIGMLLSEQLPEGALMEVLVRFEQDLLAADVQVVSVIPHAALFLHNCRFTRLGTADRNWLIEYLRARDRPPV